MKIQAILLVLIFPAFSLAQADSGPAKEFYDPVERKIEGWTILVDPKLLYEENRELGEDALKSLANHLQRVTYILPKDRVKELRRLQIWVELKHPELTSMQYHPGRGWLVKRGYDPRLVNKVHIPQAKALLDPKMWAKHPYVVLHELAHSYHDQVLGFDDPRVVEAYERAKASGTYSEVVDHRGKVVKHYGMNNPMEYFAEATEAYLGVNDFFPFVRAELEQHDPMMFRVLREIWGTIR